MKEIVSPINGRPNVPGIGFAEINVDTFLRPGIRPTGSDNSLALGLTEDKKGIDPTSFPSVANTNEKDHRVNTHIHTINIIQGKLRMPVMKRGITTAAIANFPIDLKMVTQKPSSLYVIKDTHCRRIKLPVH